MKNGMLRKYFRKKRTYSFLYIFLFLSFNLYFIFLLHDINITYLLYLDFLMIIIIMMFLWIDYTKFQRTELQKERLLQSEDIIYQQIPMLENKEIIEHDIEILQRKLQEEFEVNCDLQDGTTKYCHEVKIPLSAAFLINEKITDTEVRLAMRENLERINQQLNAMLLGCKLQSSLFDLQVKKVSIQECIKISIRNNQFFLIQKHFSIDVSLGEKTIFIYTDPSWLVYVLDQLLNNAIKYRGEYPFIKIWAEEIKKNYKFGIKLFIEDYGVGIKKSDLRRIFEKGFTGSNYHNGKYKSTGMGLYLVAKIIERLGHEIYVESHYGSSTRFCIIFWDN